MNVVAILSFFRDLEYLEIPDAGYPKNSKFQWVREVTSEDDDLSIAPCEDIIAPHIPYYRIYLGCPQQAELVRRVERAICGNKKQEGFLEDRIGNRRGALATFTLDWAGRLIKGSFRVAPFVFATTRLSNGEDLSGLQSEISKFEENSENWIGGDFQHRFKDLTNWKMRHSDLKKREEIALKSGDIKEFVRIEKMREDLEAQDIQSSGKKVSLDRLRNLIKRLSKKIDLHWNQPILVAEGSRKWQEERRFPYPPSAEGFQSYYFDELDRILRSSNNGFDPESVMGQFLVHGESAPDRREVMKDAEEINNSLSPNRFASARWPANPHHALSLAQQIGVQHAIDRTCAITAVNGPPGTGKTTLLRDVIANTVVDRARTLAALKRPGDAFRIKGGVALAKSDLVAGSEIVVASNGNRAVENITLEIPRRTEIDATTYPEALYLPEAAEAVAIAFERPCEAWGLIAAALGKKGNISKTLGALRNGARSKDGNDKRSGLIAALEARGKPKKGEWKKEVAAFCEDIEVFSEIMRHRSNEEGDRQYTSIGDIVSLPREADRHLSSAWTDRDLDELRARIFLRALTLHEIILRSSPDGLNQFLGKFEAVLMGEEEVSLKTELALWRTFFLICPAVSTTFASMRRLPFMPGWIGCLMIDEAGQATPQSAIPGLYRAAKAVIVGDPAQLQPIFTVPLPVIEALRKIRGVSEDLSPASASVQTIADGTMDVGGYLPDPDDPKIRRWAGIPLRVHRRCAQPMFDVINQVSYDGQMVAGGNPEAAALQCPIPFSKSQWFDVRDDGGPGHVNEAEMECLEDLLRRYLGSGVFGLMPTATGLIVSPFAKVASRARGVIKKVFGEEFRDIESGTIHRFQGREADIVFMLLGSASGLRGEKSRQWATKSPNLLNVAVSRARTRLFVIGSHDDWGSMPHFEVLSEKFRSRGKDSISLYSRSPAERCGDLFDLA